MGGVPGAAGPLTCQAKCVLRRYLVAVAAAIGAVVDLVRVRVISRDQEPVRERPPHRNGEAVVRTRADGTAPADGGSKSRILRHPCSWIDQVHHIGFQQVYAMASQVGDRTHE